MYDAERQTKILEILQEKHTIGVNDLANMVYCSGSTIRRDLARLEKKGLVIRIFGAVTLNSITPNNESSFEIREKTSVVDKRGLTKKVASLIKPNSTIFIDSSSTLFYIVPFLKEIPNLLIITNGLRIANEILIHTNHTVIMIGGTLKPNTNSVLGILALEQIKNFHADLAILSCFGISTEYGTSEASADTALLKKEMAKQSNKVVCAFTKSKLEIEGTFKSVPLEEIDYVVVNEEIEEKDKKAFLDKGVELVY